MKRKGNYPYYLPYNSHDFLKNLVVDQLIVLFFIFSLILNNCLLDIILIL